MHKLPILGAPTTNDAQCSACGGQCCKSYPGLYAPEDVGAPDLELMKSRVADLLRQGRAAIDHWEGHPQDDTPRDAPYAKPRISLDGLAWFLRAPQAGYGDRIFHAMWMGSCALLGEKGCKLEHDARPYNCRSVRPARIPEVVCVPRALNGEIITKQEFVVAWLPYANLLEEVGEMVQAESRLTTSERALGW